MNTPTKHGLFILPTPYLSAMASGAKVASQATATAISPLLFTRLFTLPLLSDPGVHLFFAIGT